MTGVEFSMPHLQEIVDAVRSVGVPVIKTTVPDDCLLPGVLIDRGQLLVDESKLAHAGDVAHDAAHIAVMTPEQRARAVGTLPPDPAQEIVAHAWCYALAKSFDLPVEVIFHDAYAAGGPTLRAGFEDGALIGQPLLEWFGMTSMRGDGDPQSDLPRFPNMGKWIRDGSESTAMPSGTPPA